MNAKNAKYFDSSVVEHIQKGTKKIMGNKSTKPNIYRTQAYDLLMRRYFCIEFINFM